MFVIGSATRVKLVVGVGTGTVQDSIQWSMGWPEVQYSTAHTGRDELEF